MNCEEYLLLISGHLDGANSELEERCLQEHLQTCPSCRALLAQMEENDALLKRSAAVPPADLTDRIMREVRKEKQAAASRKKRWIPVAASGLAAAALLGLVVWGGLPFFNTSKDSALPDNKMRYNGFVSTEAAEADGVLFEAAAETGSAEDVESPVEVAVPDLPAYRDLTTTANTTEGTAVKGSAGSYSTATPMLIVWNAAEPDTLAAYEPEELSEYAPLREDWTPSLFSRYQAVIPVLRTSDRISPADGFVITVYTVPYETMTEVFDTCVGVYETAVYYPASFAPEECSVVLINTNESD